MNRFDENEIICELYYHILWSTKGQELLLSPGMFSQINGIVQQIATDNDCSVIALGGTSDHLQLLVKAGPHFVMDAFILDTKVASSMLIIARAIPHFL